MSRISNTLTTNDGVAHTKGEKINAKNNTIIRVCHIRDPTTHTQPLGSSYVLDTPLNSSLWFELVAISPLVTNRPKYLNFTLPHDQVGVRTRDGFEDMITFCKLFLPDFTSNKKMQKWEERNIFGYNNENIKNNDSFKLVFLVVAFLALSYVVFLGHEWKKKEDSLQYYCEFNRVMSRNYANS
ncbi:CLUMA_CG018520, isoform A [Clunio marinus]|uniref:CLUMA_CG018520, isoform A n=1 Tax=Clunio marinus TaxID=568069 RepID=A0A1J1IZP4_9DIPT|nr:CLUMA_CG018520, isoform A [Clunio marinus]